MNKYKCLLCGKEFELAEGAEIICPLCKATGDKIKAVTAEPANKYAASTS